MLPNRSLLLTDILVTLIQSRRRLFVILFSSHSQRKLSLHIIVVITNWPGQASSSRPRRLSRRLRRTLQLQVFDNIVNTLEQRVDELLGEM